jgi:hypothetical protein
MVAILKKLKNLYWALAILPSTATAASIIDDPTAVPTTAEDVEKLISRLRIMVEAAAGAIAVAMIIYGAMILLTAGGNEERMGKAKKIITYAVGGIVFILLAEVLLRIFVAALGGGIN